MKLSNRVAIVTGGASGIGKAIVEKFLQEGAKVMIADFSQAGDKLAKQLSKEDEQRAAFFKTDVTNEKNVKDLIEETIKVFG